MPGVTPDRWRRAWQERNPHVALELFPIGQDDARAALDAASAGRPGPVPAEDSPVDASVDGVAEAAAESGGVRPADMVLARLPVDLERPTPLHQVVLYEELPVVVVGTEHFVAASDGDDEIEVAELDGEQLVLPHPSGWAPSAEQLPFPVMGVKEAIEVVASGTGVVVVPMSVARLHHRKDVTHRVVAGLPPTEVALLWPRDADSALHQDFVGVVRGRRPGSSR